MTQADQNNLIEMIRLSRFKGDLGDYLHVNTFEWSYEGLKMSLLQVRLELTTSASLRRLLSYKYRALTDCATGALCPLPSLCL